MFRTISAHNCIFLSTFPDRILRSDFFLKESVLFSLINDGGHVNFFAESAISIKSRDARQKNNLFFVFLQLCMACPDVIFLEKCKRMIWKSLQQHLSLFIREHQCVMFEKNGNRILSLYGKVKKDTDKLTATLTSFVKYIVLEKDKTDPALWEFTFTIRQILQNRRVQRKG